MLNKIATFTFSAAIYLVAQGLLSLSASPNQEPQVSRLTLQIPFTPTSTLPLDWCKSADSRATGRPFGLNKVRYTRRTHLIEGKEEIGIAIFGCITNNSGQVLKPRLRFSNFEVRSTIHYNVPPYASATAYETPTFTLTEPNPILPGQTALFSTEPYNLNDASFHNVRGITLWFGRHSSPQDSTYERLQQVNITFVR